MGFFSRKQKEFAFAKKLDRDNFKQVRKPKVKRLKSYVEKKLDRIEWRLGKVYTKLLYLPGLNNSERLMFANARKKSSSNIQQIRSLLKEIRDEINRIKI